MGEKDDDDDPGARFALRMFEEIRALLPGLAEEGYGDLDAEFTIHAGGGRPDIAVIRRRSTGEVLWVNGPRLHRAEEGEG